MPELVEQMYCSQQIVIPPKFPYILKRYCKAAIKTQPYDLLRWSFEYFRALAEHRPPPVKLRLEYPIYSTEGGLTRGCLKVLANQLISMKSLPLNVAKRAWQAFCLDPKELKRIFCLCEVYRRADFVPFFHFIAVAAGMLTKCLTHTMILLCESLTKEPDGGSAAIPLEDFLEMYHFLAKMEAGADVKYFDGVREGTPEEKSESIVSETIIEEESESEVSDDGFWEGTWHHFKRVSLIDGKVGLGDRISTKVILPLIGQLERSPSVERAKQIERANYQSDRKGKPLLNEEVEKKLKTLSTMHMEKEGDHVETDAKKEDEQKKTIDICVFDENNEEVDFAIYGEPSMGSLKDDVTGDETNDNEDQAAEEEVKEEVDQKKMLKEKIALYVAEVESARRDRLACLEQLLDEIASLVDRFNSANYDLGMVAGRQMSTTSGEFIVQHIEKEIMAYVDDQIAILPDPDLKKKKAKPEEVEMVRLLLENFINDNMSIIVPEIEEVEEEEVPIPEITIVYAVPGIGPRVDDEIIHDFEEYCREVTKVQAEVMMPRNIRHYLCPPLEKYVEYKNSDHFNYETGMPKPKKEEAAVEGKITD